MKLRFLSIVPLLLLTSCGSETVVDNVLWYFDSGKDCYMVLDGPRNKYGEIETYEKSWKVGKDRVYFIYTSEKYIEKDSKRIYNSYYVSSNKLYVYNIL